MTQARGDGPVGDPAGAPRLGAEEVLQGLTGRRVSAALYAIESRAGLLALADRHAAAPAICEGMVVTAERDYLAAVATGTVLPSPPRVQHLERSAPAWAHLVPSSPSTRADLAHAFAARYPARARDVPRVRGALGCADPLVREAHSQRHGIPMEAVWADRLPLAERLRWWGARAAALLEDLPPFWSAFALTLTQTVGAGILALPIAVAGVGPIPGLVLIVVLGLVNVLTVSAVAESVVRTGTVRWSGAYLGGVVRQHLGRHAALLSSLALAAYAIASLVAYYIGLSSTLAESLGLPAPVWVAVLFLVTLSFVQRRQFGATIVSALLVGALNLLIIALLIVAALTRLDPARLTRAEVPFGGGDGFDPSVLGLVFGVILMSYFGHTAVAAGARTILRRDPGGASLVRGSAAAMVVVILLYAGWTLAVGGAVDGGSLMGESGTALVPLAEELGPAVWVLGTVFVVGAMGMAAVHSSVGLHSQTAELLRGVGRAGGTGGRGRAEGPWARWAAAVPLLVVFLLVEALVLTGRASFTAALGLVGALAIPVVAGLVPVLLVASARRRGDYVPEVSLGWLASPAVLTLAYLLFLAAVAVHGLVIWTGAFERALAVAVVVLVVGVTVQVARSRAFRPLTTLEIRRDRDLGLDSIQATAWGQRVRADLRSAGPSGAVESEFVGSARLPERTSAAELTLPPLESAELAVWAHEVDGWGGSDPLPATVAVDGRMAQLGSDGTDTVRVVAGVQVTVTIGLGGPR